MSGGILYKNVSISSAPPPVLMTGICPCRCPSCVWFLFSVILQDDSNRQDCTDTTSQINKSLIKRFNQHSTMVLKTCDRKRRVDNNGSRPVEENFNGVVGGNAKQPTLPESSAVVEEGSELSKRVRGWELWLLFAPWNFLAKYIFVLGYVVASILWPFRA